jgi:hypothetical protein
MKFFTQTNPSAFVIFELGKLSLIYWKSFGSEFASGIVRFENKKNYVVYIHCLKFELSWKNINK